MAATQKLLSRLQNVSREHQKGKLTCWSARCPAHEDRAPSLSVADDNGTVLIHCYAGCSPADIVAAVGMNLSDLFPRKLLTGKPGRHLPWLGATAFKAIVFDALVVANIASTMRQNREISEQDYEFLWAAIERLQRTEERAYG
jgi:hypothetical protein